MLWFCLENIPRDGEGGSCRGSLLCQHLNRICSGCSHLIHTVPHFQSLFQSFYLSLKAFNCFLSVSRLESAQVSGWRYPLGQGIVALSPRERASERAAAVFARAADRPPRSRASAATSVGVYTDGSRWRGAGAWKKTEAMGGFVALPADFPPAKSISPSVSLGEAGERCGKKLPGGQISATALVTGFPDHFTCFPFITRSHAWDMEKPPQKTCSE